MGLSGPAHFLYITSCPLPPKTICGWFCTRESAVSGTSDSMSVEVNDLPLNWRQVVILNVIMGHGKG